MCGFVFSSSENTLISGFKSSYDKIFHRGPASNKLISDSQVLWGFHRLSIMDLSNNGDQPFVLDEARAMCNGEIYNFTALKESLKNDYEFTSESDCEVILPLYRKLGAHKLFTLLDGEYALVIHDGENIIAGRDPIGIRSLFYGHDTLTGKIAFASEAKGLIDFCHDVKPFPPGHFYLNGEFTYYNDISKAKFWVDGDLDEITSGIKTHLERGIIKRLHSDAPLGFLLSGGLDSSLVCAISAKHLGKPIKTFAIGMDSDPIDLKYAKEVAEFIGSDHTEVIITKEDVLGALDEVVYHLETWDITTIRASIRMYLICKYIRENTDIKVLLTGEVSDELFGYKYTDFAPTPEEFQKEAEKRVRELYLYDVLRADRCIAAHSLEARVPFGDIDFVDYVMSINPTKKMNIYGQGKYLLRKAFANDRYLPDSILFREKAAFSDAVGHSLVDYLKEFAESSYSDEDLKNASTKYPYKTPFTKESLLYRDLFEKYYHGKATWIKDFWMPNKTWGGCDVDDPSARVLKNYGKSGK